MPNGEAEANRRTIVEDVDCETTEADHVGEAIDDIRDILERVGEGAARRHVGLPKRRQVGSDEVKPVRELRDEIAEHVAGGGKAVQQEDRWRVLRPSLAVEDPDAVDIHLPVRDRVHGNSFRSCDDVLAHSKERAMRETTGRVAAYSDAVFAVIVTVMVLEYSANPCH